MSKLIKRIRKFHKNPENCVVIGDVWGELPYVIDLFKNIFIKITKKPYIKSKNVIARDNFEDLTIFPQIEYVFIDGDCLKYLNSIEKVFTHYSPMIYIGYGEFLNEEFSKYLLSLSYEIIEIRKEYQIWKRKR
jgi:hypothetical protein